jgi:hypothetical protein
MEDASHSYKSKFFAMISIGFIFASICGNSIQYSLRKISILGLILGSMPEFQSNSTYAAAYHIYHQRQRHRSYEKFDDIIGDVNLAMYNMTGYTYKPTDDPTNWLISLENICIVWFTIEYLLR